MSTNLIIQYTIVAVLIIGALLWILIKVLRKPPVNDGCCGCALSDKCKTQNRQDQPCKDKKS